MNIYQNYFDGFLSRVHKLFYNDLREEVKHVPLEESPYSPTELVNSMNINGENIIESYAIPMEKFFKGISKPDLVNLLNFISARQLSHFVKGHCDTGLSTITKRLFSDFEKQADNHAMQRLGIEKGYLQQFISRMR